MFNFSTGVIARFFRAMIWCGIFLASCQIASGKETYTRIEVLADIDQIVAKLKKHHPNLYAHRKPKEFRKIVKAIKVKTKENSSRIEAAIQFQQVLSAVCDEHTKLNFDYQTEKETFSNARFPGFNLLLRDKQAIIQFEAELEFSRISNIGNGISSQKLSEFFFADSNE